MILIIILLYIANSVTQSCSQNQSGSVIISQTIDTVYTKPDTTIITRVDTVHKLIADLDTVYIDSTEVITAAADTTFVEDSSSVSVKYYFPPLNYFDINLDIKSKVIEKTKTITEVKEIERPNPFYSDHWFWTTIGLVLLLINNIVK